MLTRILHCTAAVCEDNGKNRSDLAFTTDGEPTYRVIRGGLKLDDAPYGVVHRIAAAKGTHGAASFCMNWHGAVRQHPYRHAREQQPQPRVC